MKISAVILTKNEEKQIETCLKSAAFCDEIIIVDDFSKDLTLDKVKKFAAKSKIKTLVFQRNLNNDFAGQRNYGLEKANYEWILFIDADEIVTVDLKKEILRWTGNGSSSLSAFFIKRRDFFWDRELKYGETKKVYTLGLIRLVRKKSGSWSGKVHEEFRLKDSTMLTERSRGFINHYPHGSVKEFIEQVNFYSTLRAKELLEHKKSTNLFEIIFFPAGKFLYTFILCLGFMDRAAGFAYSFFMAFHSFLVRAKLYQYINIKPAK